MYVNINTNIRKVKLKSKELPQNHKVALLTKRNIIDTL